jgi:SAM-dependent methyltransferase
MSEAYARSFYEEIGDNSARSASEVVPIVLKLLTVTSVCDLGCGLGTWLAAFKMRGVTDVSGIDGDYVPRDLLRIPAEAFVAADLQQPVDPGRTFDLALSLEVAEHLPSQAAETFVASLTRLAPVILFSAAIPHQGGTEHVNEQWPDYWVELFKARGYVPLDAIRWRIWNNEAIESWYRQNMFFFVRESALDAYPRLREPVPVEALPRNLVHPRLFEKHLPTPDYLSGTVKKLPKLIAEAINRRLPGKTG